ncbi:MAG: acetyl-CoA carboxylase carboxyltransferase subunit alpha [Nitrospirae bacterium]|nr:acetyl-CoA carboxylase carboxyltransferase subunit alpha [Nitrospirota bacterium]
MANYLEFEKPIADLERQIAELRRFSHGQGVDLTKEVARLEKKLHEVRKSVYEKLTPWQKTLAARHPDRPYTLDYIKQMMTGFHELHGDRRFGDDAAIVSGFARIDDMPVAVIGHQKGRDTKDRIARNFGQAHPEGYRKALRIMKLAEKFGRPVITFIDTPGAYPGIGAEERGQAEAIAYNLHQMAMLRTPVVILVIGEGGSGGALALGVGDRVYMLEHSVYSVISPEGCAAILWKKDKSGLSLDDFSKAADVLKLTPGDLKRFGVIDEVIKEPPGGMHTAGKAMFDSVKSVIKTALDELAALPADELVAKRYSRIRVLGSIG